MNKLTTTFLCLSFLVLIAGCSGNSSKPKSSLDARRTEAARINTELGAGYMHRGSYALAKEKLEKALQYDYKYAIAHSALAVLNEELGEGNTAEKHHKLAVKYEPDNASVQNNYGAFLCKNGKYRMAEEYFVRAANNAFYQTPEVALVNAGRCVTYIPDWERAEKHFRDAIVFKTNYSDALYALSELKYQQQDYFTARAFLQRYEADSPASADSLLLGYRIERSLERPEQAAEYARQLERKFPDTAQATELKNDKPAT